jgi:hypothetical protein
MVNSEMGRDSQAPIWPLLRGEEREPELTALREWVDEFLRPVCEGYVIPDCWPAHNEAVWELATLHTEWLRVYGDPHDQPLGGALLFFDQWLPGVRARLFGPDGAVRCPPGSCARKPGPG